MEMIGFRYDPTDDELMKILMKKVNDAEQDTRQNHHFIMNDCEIYGKIPPWEIYDSHTHYHLHTFHRKLYVFTDLKTTSGNRVCRAAACGTWLEKSKPKRLYDSQGNVIGIDKMLSFKAKDLHSSKFNKTNWIMHEFSLANQEFGRTNTVLCVIYKLNKGSGSDCEEANGRGLKRAFSSTADEEFSCFNTTAAAVISLKPEPEPEPEMPSADDEEFAAWVSGCFSSTAAVSEEASTFNTTGVMSHGQEDAQAQEHKKRRLDAVADADAVTNEEFAACIDDPTFPDEPLSQIFSDLPPLVEVCSQSKSDSVADFDALITSLISDPTQADEGIMAYGFLPIWRAMGYASPCSGLAGWLDRSTPVICHNSAVPVRCLCTGVLMFIRILTSRYAKEDFLESLPRKMILGRSTLFFSIAAMMTAFSAALFLMLHEQSWIFKPVIYLASIPITLFVLMQFTLLVAMEISTYRPSIFERKIKR
uniref:NAC domain-containing protein n=1 Tax=Quercus lobata TaxID=97700 RepID=A0A7N2QZX3_QUELO